MSSCAKGSCGDTSEGASAQIRVSARKPTETTTDFLPNKRRSTSLVLLSPATHPWPGGGVTWYYDLTRLPVIGWLFSELLAVPGGHLRYHDGVAEVFAPQKTPQAYEQNSGTKLVLRPQVFRYNAMDVTSLYEGVSMLSPRYGEIDAPVSIITGDSDDIVLAEVHSKGLERDIRGAKLVWLPGEGHAPAWTNPQAVISEIERVSAAAKARSR